MQYNIIGGTFPVVTCTLADGESMITEGGSMVWMAPNMEMSTTGGGIGKMFSKAVSGESLFQNIWTARGNAMIAFAEIDGDLVEYQLAAGQQMVVDTGNVAGFEESVSIEAQMVKGAKNILLGGEGMFNTVLTGPGRIWLQTMPISSLAAAIAPMVSSGN